MHPRTAHVAQSLQAGGPPLAASRNGSIAMDCPHRTCAFAKPQAAKEKRGARDERRVVENRVVIGSTR
jgi:hypothetical protein